MVSGHSSATDHRDTEMDGYQSQVLEEAPGPPPELTKRGHMQSEAGPRHMPLLRSVGGVLWGSGTKVSLVNSHQKSRVLVSFSGGLSQGSTGGGSRRGRDC